MDPIVAYSRGVGHAKARGCCKSRHASTDFPRQECRLAPQIPASRLILALCGQRRRCYFSSGSLVRTLSLLCIGSTDRRWTSIRAEPASGGERDIQSTVRRQGWYIVRHLYYPMLQASAFLKPGTYIPGRCSQTRHQLCVSRMTSLAVSIVAYQVGSNSRE